MKIDIYDATGKVASSAELNEALFSAPINEDLMHRAVIMRLANRRTPVAHTKTRGEVKMTTAKAFRQKGTGRARRGALSTSLLRGGGVAHGPRNNANYSKAMPKKERRAALFSSLSSQAKAKNVFGLKDFSVKTPQTKAFADLLAKLPKGKKYLFVLPAKNEIFEKSCRNIPGVQTILASYLNPYDVLHADQVCFVSDSLGTVESTFLAAK